MIPRIFHQIWVGPSALPDEYGEYQQSWLEHHPGWELRLWTEDNLPDEPARPEVRDKLRAPAERSDILRLDVLHRFGGVYIDTDFECRRSIEPLIEGLDFFTAYLKPDRINNAIIGAAPGHAFLRRALDELRPREFHGYDKDATGPSFLNNLIRQYPELKIFEAELFYPNTATEKRRAYAVHHAGRSWQDSAFLQEKILQLKKEVAEGNEAKRRLEKTRAALLAARAELEHRGRWQRRLIRSLRPVRGALTTMRRRPTNA